MSIAVSVVVRPSRLLSCMVGAMCGVAFVLGFAIAAGAAGDAASVLRATASAACLFLGVFGFYHGIRCRKPIHIDISSNGQFRLTRVRGAASCATEGWPHLQESATRVRLLSNSTIWQHLLLLRLQDEGGKITVLPILPDSVSRDNFRALSVACRWISVQAPCANKKVRIT